MESTVSAVDGAVDGAIDRGRSACPRFWVSFEASLFAAPLRGAALRGGVKRYLIQRGASTHRKPLKAKASSKVLRKFPSWGLASSQIDRPNKTKKHVRVLSIKISTGGGYISKEWHGEPAKEDQASP